MSEAIGAGEVEVTSTSVRKWIWREELEKALELWSPDVIEEALGAEAAGVLPEPVRLFCRPLRRLDAWGAWSPV
jgi:hypothetical protein